MRAVGTGISGFVLRKCSNIITAHLLFHTPCRIPLVVRGHQRIVNAVGRSVGREEGQKPDISFPIMSESHNAHFLADRIHGRIIIRCVPARVKVHIPFDRIKGSVVVSDSGVGIGQTDTSWSQILMCPLDGIRNPLYDEIVALIIVSGNAVNEVIQRIPGDIGRGRVAVCRRKHHIFRSVL